MYHRCVYLIKTIIALLNEILIAKLILKKCWVTLLLVLFTSLYSILELIVSLSRMIKYSIEMEINGEQIIIRFTEATATTLWLNN